MLWRLGIIRRLVIRKHGKIIKPPINPSCQPAKLFLSWHVREVFKGPARYV